MSGGPRPTMGADPIVLVVVGLAASAVALPVLLYYALRGETTTQRRDGTSSTREVSGARTCDTCGSSLEAGLSFCWRCGETLED